jgi:hypothetical protein
VSIACNPLFTLRSATVMPERAGSGGGCSSLPAGQRSAWLGFRLALQWVRGGGGMHGSGRGRESVAVLRDHRHETD